MDNNNINGGMQDRTSMQNGAPIQNGAPMPNGTFMINGVQMHNGMPTQNVSPVQIPGGPYNKNNGGMLKGILMGFIAAFLVFGVALGIKAISDVKGNKTVGDGSSTYQSMDEVYDKANRIKKLIDEYYYYDEDFNDIADGIYQGLIDSLGDKYADYYDAEELQSVIESNQGTYYGIGVVVQTDTETGEILVVNPYDFAPGYKAGIRAGDKIIAVDEINVVGMDLNESVKYIHGDEGTDVTLTVRRDGKEMEFVVTRAKIDNQTITVKVLDNNIGYMRISSFDGVTLDQYKAGLEELISQDIEGIIFDVRSNGGGFYYTVVEMLDKILPEGKIVYTEDKNGNQEIEYSDANCIDLPMCVLVDGYTASASEIFAGAIQDYELGAIIGQKTYGKGIVQNTYDLGDGTAIKFTIAGYFTPNGRNIHGDGITPDIEVELPENLGENMDAYDKETGILKLEYDTQLQRAISYMNEQLGIE